MPTIQEVTRYLDEMLNPRAFSADASNNGLQYEGSGTVTKAVFGVDACSALFSEIGRAHV